MPMLCAEVDLLGERLLLHPHRALFWPRMRWLVVSDLHLGKAAHFRKAGSAMPEGHDASNLERLDALIAQFRPERLLFLGDLFHSSHNARWEWFAAWALRQPCSLHLVPGNHDVLDRERYGAAGLQMHSDTLEEGPFVFAHEPMENPGCYVISGHVHPAIVLSGRARQRIKLPCFHFSATQGLLPAFGLATGGHVIRPSVADRVFALAGSSVLDVSEVSGARVGPGC